jgi:TPR repeat protein
MQEAVGPRRKGDTFVEQGLGVLYLEGTGVPKDALEVDKWLRKSAEHGNASGQLKLVFLYLSDGTGRAAVVKFWNKVLGMTTEEKILRF